MSGDGRDARATATRRARPDAIERLRRGADAMTARAPRSSSSPTPPSRSTRASTTARSTVSACCCAWAAGHGSGRARRRGAAAADGRPPIAAAVGFSPTIAARQKPPGSPGGFCMCRLRRTRRVCWTVRRRFATRRRLAGLPASVRPGRIAQLVEQLTLNQRVPGSSPGAPTKIPSQIRWFDECAGRRKRCASAVSIVLRS